MGAPVYRYSAFGYQSMMLVESAAEKPSVLKLISVAVQSARPAMTGKRDRFTHRPGGTEEGFVVAGGCRQRYSLQAAATGDGMEALLVRLVFTVVAFV